MIVTIANAKGGVAKTTSVRNIGDQLALLGKKVLLIDFDPQSNLTASFNIYDPPVMSMQFAKPEEDYTPPIIQLNEFLHISPATPSLTNFDRLAQDFINENEVLKIRLTPLKSFYDVILIDTAPGLDIRNRNSIIASDRILIPVQPERFCFEGTKTVISYMERVQKQTGSEIELSGLFFTQPSNTTLHKMNRADFKLNIKGHFYETEIRRNVKVAEAHDLGVSLFDYAPDSNGALDYRNLTLEFITREKL